MIAPGPLAAHRRDHGYEPFTTRAFVVARRRKGRKVKGTLREVGRVLRAAGWEVDGQVVKRKRNLGRLATWAVNEGVDVVVAVGGDGSVLQVAAALADTDVALGIIPTGTGNLLAGNLRIPRRPDRAAKVLVEGRRRRIDLGSIMVDGKDCHFAVACGVGFDAEVMRATDRPQKERWGKLAYFASALGQTRTIRNVPHTITLDGEVSTTEAAQVVIANFGRMLPALGPRREIEPDDGFFDVIVIRASGPLPGLLAGWEVLRRTELGESPTGRVVRARAREVRVETHPSRLVQADGSVIGRTPIIARVRPGALAVIVPRR